jgi:hypothetical protein
MLVLQDIRCPASLKRQATTATEFRSQRLSIGEALHSVANVLGARFCSVYQLDFRLARKPS